MASATRETRAASPKNIANEKVASTPRTPIGGRGESLVVVRTVRDRAPREPRARLTILNPAPRPRARVIHVRPTVLDAFPRLGWVDAPTPVTALPDLADVLGLAWLGVKRDDRLPTLHGGSKVRKLDFALAAPTVARAPTWTSFGAIGSGHLSTLTAAATHLERRLLARCFFEPLGPWVEEELAFTA